MKKFFTLIAAVLASSSMMAQVEYSEKNSNPNADCEGDDFTCYAVKPNKMADGSANGLVFTGESLTTENGIVGEAGSRSVSVLAAAGAADDWDSQFWIVLPHSLDVGEHVFVRFDYKMETDAKDEDGFDLEELNIGTQAHGNPGDYHHWQAIGDVTFKKGEWQTYEAEISVGGDWTTDGSGNPDPNLFKAIAFNLCQNNKDFDVTFYFDNLEIYYEQVDETLTPYWAPIVNNSDMEGENTSNFIFRVQGLGDENPTPKEGVGVEGSKGLELVVPGVDLSVDANAWAHQFFIKFNESIPAGDMIKVSFDYRASEDMANAIDTQSHGKSAGDYNHYTAVGSPTFKSEWQHHEFTQSVSSEQSPADKGYQFIAFNLGKSDHEVTLYLDNIVVKHKIMVSADENPAQRALAQTLADIEAKYNMDNLTKSAYPANEEIRNAFAEAYEECVGADDEADFEALQDALLAAESKFAGSVKDYTNLNNYIKLIQEKAAQAEEMGENYADLKSELESISDPLINSYDAEQWERADINEVVNNQKIYDLISDFVLKTMKQGDDVTIMMNNSKYNWGNSSWTGNPSTHYTDELGGTAERWHTDPFDVNQTLKNMPNGVYVIKMSGFQRIDSNDNGEVGVANTQMYANDAAKTIILRDEYDEENDVEEAPNSMAAADVAFYENGLYVNTLNVILAEDGDLKIGVKGGGENKLNWSIWGNFHVIYMGTDAESLAFSILDQVDRVNTLAEALDGTLNSPIQSKILDMTDAAEKVAAKAGLTQDEVETTVKGLIDLCAEMQDVSKLMKSVEDAYSAFQESYSACQNGEVEPAENIAERAKVADAGYDESSENYYFEMSTDELEAFLAEVKYLTGALKINKGVSSASEEEPFDLTSLFVNPNFDNYAEIGANANYNGWDGSGFGTGGGTAGPVAERWNQSNGFNTYVDFVGLPAGKYVLSCDGAYRTNIDNDWNIVYGEATTENEVFLYAKTSVYENSVAINNIVTGKMTEAEAEANGIDVTANVSSKAVQVSTGETDEEGNEITESVKYYFPDQLFTADQWIKAGAYKKNSLTIVVPEDGNLRVGARRKGQANDWAFLDNFELMYYGPDATAIQSIATQKSAVKGIYTISGVRVSNAKRAGLYIINGKKVMVK